MAVAIAGCGGSSEAAAPTAPLETIVPWRAATAGEAALARLAPDPDLVIELDLARLRSNPVVGDLAAARLGDLEPVLGVELDGASTVVLASYGVGTDEATTVTIVDGAVAAGPALFAEGAGVGDDLLALRARAMPEQAEGAVLRITATLDAEARAELARRLEAPAVPGEVSIWGDVVDDLALVAWIGRSADREAVVDAVKARLDALARERTVSALGLTPAVRGVKVVPDGDDLRLIGLIGPRRLERAAARARAYLQLGEGESK